MAHITVSRSHALSMAAAKRAAQDAADALARKYGLQSAWEGDTLRFHRAGVRGGLVVTPRKITIDLELGMMFAPFKTAFEEQIRASLDKTLA